MKPLSRAELITAYHNARKVTEHARSRIDPTLSIYANQNGYLFSSRLKTLESYLEKLDTGRSNTTQLDDLFACSLVVPTLPDIEKCIQKLPKLIKINDRRDSSKRKKEPESFSFDDTILICSLDKDPSIPTAPERQNLFEIQVRTLAQYSWSIVTHPLAYKGEDVDWRKLRLAAQLRAAAEQLDTLYSLFSSISNQIPPSHSDKVDNLFKIASTLSQWLSSGLIPEEFRPSSMSRVANSVYDLARRLNLSLKLDTILTATEKHLRTTGYPPSLSIFQLILGVAISNQPSIDWGKLRLDKYRILITQDLVSIFPKCNAVPEKFRVQAATDAPSANELPSPTDQSEAK